MSQFIIGNKTLLSHTLPKESKTDRQHLWRLIRVIKVILEYLQKQFCKKDLLPKKKNLASKQAHKFLPVTMYISLLIFLFWLLNSIILEFMHSNIIVAAILSLKYNVYQYYCIGKSLH